MVYLREEAHVKTVRVFKWNQKILLDNYYNAIPETKGLFVIHIKDKIKTITPHKDPEIELINKTVFEYKVINFNVTALLSQVSIQKLSHSMASKANLFFSKTIQPLTEQISDYLLTRFCFTRQTLLGTTSPKIIIFLQIDRTSIADYTHQDINYISIPAPRFTTEDQQERHNHDLMDLEANMDGEDVLEILDRITEKAPGVIEVNALQIKEIDSNGQVLDCCPICLEGFRTGMEVAETACSHLFHRGCIFQWFPNHNSCPMCRSVCIASI